MIEKWSKREDVACRLLAMSSFKTVTAVFESGSSAVGVESEKRVSELCCGLPGAYYSRPALLPSSDEVALAARVEIRD